MEPVGRTKVVYVAGRFRGRSNWAIKQNVQAAERAGLQVAECGAMPLIPHKNTENFHGLLTDQFWLDGTAELLRRCDGVYVFDRGWQESKGTIMEIDLARALRIPVFFTLEDLSYWLGRLWTDEKTDQVDTAGRAKAEIEESR